MRSTKPLLLLFAVIFSGMFFSGCEQEGCTDVNAINFNPNADENNGTCIYASRETIIDDGSGVGTVTWTKDKTYILDGFVFVNSGQTLTIEPGTVVRGRPGTGTNASALIVARGGTIIAEGTADEPIIFTGLDDDPENPNDIPFGTNSLWGGLVILGNASLNTVPGEQAIEGLPTSELRGLYGGSDDNDNSGILKYVSIRYGGTDIGASNEINGLTLGGVGSGTEIDYVEVYSNFDDGIEWFGGTVDAKHLAVAFCGDDSYDYDQGWRGRVQYGFSVNGSNTGDRGGEHDGGTDPEAGIPYATPIFSNCTYIGQGPDADKRALTFRDNAGGEYHNSIFVNYAKGVDIEILPGADHSYAQFEKGNLNFTNNYFYNVADQTMEGVFRVNAGGNDVSQEEIDQASTNIRNAFMDDNNVNVDPGVSMDYNSNVVSPQPTADAQRAAVQPSETWFEQVSYKGAFDGTSNWLAGWSALSQNGHFN